MPQILIIGAGLIGTSIGLAATKNGLTCTFVDSNPRNQALANQLCGSEGVLWADNEVDLVVVATTVPELPIVVFDMNTPGNLLKIATGDGIGTLVKD